MADLIISSLRGGTWREQLAWAAGLFEGEGSFSYQRRGKYMTIQVELGMTDEDRVRAFHKVIGLGTVNGPYPNDSRKTGRGRPIYRWKVGSFEDVQAVIAMLWFGLGPRRKAKAVELLKEYHAYKRINRASKDIVDKTKELLSAGVPKRKIATLVGKSYGFVNHIKRGRTHASAVEVAPQCLIS